MSETSFFRFCTFSFSKIQTRSISPCFPPIACSADTQLSSREQKRRKFIQTKAADQSRSGGSEEGKGERRERNQFPRKLLIKRIFIALSCDSHLIFLLGKIKNKEINYTSGGQKRKPWSTMILTLLPLPINAALFFFFFYKLQIGMI